MKHPAKRRAFVTELPTDLTPLLREWVSGLSASPKSDYLKREIFSKFVSEDTAPADVRKNAAIRKWLATERDNEATNDRLILTPDDYSISRGVPFGRFVEVLRNKVAEIIGETSPVDALIGSFSGGASTSRSRTRSYPASKYVGEAHATRRALEVFQELLVPEVPGWINDENSLQYVEVRGNAMFTVPKTSDIDRVACKEPDLNMFIQKGIGNFFRSRLRASGINLNDQSKNRSLAQRGSVTGSLCTIDLSSASDSVSTELVFLALPVCWYTLLDSVRSPVTIIDGEEHQNHMFSSMGNGFTFELESLLFIAICRSVAYLTGTRGVLSVYGDDIICPSEMAPVLIEVLGYLGFQTNIEKTHFTGFFRESCGGHYLHGLDITPFYVKEPIKTLDKLIDVANKLRRWADLDIGTDTCVSVLDPEVEPFWLHLKTLVPQQFWGGSDLSFKYQLVSPDTPRSRLSEETKRKYVGIGGFYHWLNATGTRDRETDGISTSVLTRGSGSFRIRPVRDLTVPRLAAYWLSEL